MSPVQCNLKEHPLPYRSFPKLRVAGSSPVCRSIENQVVRFISNYFFYLLIDYSCCYWWLLWAISYICGANQVQI